MKKVAQRRSVFKRLIPIDSQGMLNIGCADLDKRTNVRESTRPTKNYGIYFGSPWSQKFFTAALTR